MLIGPLSVCDKLCVSVCENKMFVVNYSETRVKEVVWCMNTHVVVHELCCGI
jgi:hypothetical protein